MSQSEKKLYIFSIFIIVLMSLLFCVKKQGLFTDEIYTYGLANSYFTPYIADIYGGNLIDKIVVSKDLFNYITVGFGERFRFDSVFYNQGFDTLPPLYYCLIHLICSFFPETFTKWFGLSINLLLYTACLVILFKLGYKVFEDYYSSIIVMIFYGLSTIGMSTMLMIRMYILLTFLTAMLAYFSIQLIENRNIKYCTIVLLIHYLGMMTHYYYGVYAFFLFLISIYHLIKIRQYRFIGLYVLFNVLGGILFLVTFPAFLNQLIAPKLVSGHTAYSNLFMLSSYTNILNYFLTYFSQTLSIQIFTVLLIILCCLKKKKALIANKVKCYYSIVTIPAILTLIIVSVISPIIAERYIYNLVPIFCLFIAREIKIMHLSDGSLFRFRYKSVLILLCINIIILFFNPPTFLYPQMPKINKMLKMYSDYPCVFFDNNYSSPVTENLIQLMLFNSFIVVNDVNSKFMREYIQENQKNERVILYVDKNRFFSSGYNSEEVLFNIMETSEYKNYKYLYSNYSVDVYVLNK